MTVSTVSNSPGTGATTQQQLSAQWTNPNDVLSVLLIVGGDIVQKALAQGSGGYFTPICFSFGWVSYSLNTLIAIVGDGHLLPEPDHPVKVYNLKSGYVRENKNWVIGRIARDNVMHLNKMRPLDGNAIRISIYDALEDTKGPSVAATGRLRAFGVATMILQLFIASIPFGRYREWGVFLVTAAGTGLALVAGALPQWRAEKLPCQTKVTKDFALTSGNGSRDIMIIRGNGVCLDLEELAAPQMPRSARIWEGHPLLSRPVTEDGIPKVRLNRSKVYKTWTPLGIPIGFWITIAVTSTQFVFWVAILISVAGLRAHVWYLLGVGALGMLQNVIVAAASRGPDKRNLPIKHVETLLSRKVMDGLMDLDITYAGFGEPLLGEFFPGKLRKNEKEWWAGNRDAYDDEREVQIAKRGRPRSRLPRLW
ncbi:hypothetical protein BDV96DRAFT_608287 [Lophiotrema nucula]|uniref:Uncharacterized protein n=1 Tax=Lophiotrema nucula TaxID=690887 RepID=A0A6A5YDN5_9PLEO|nr:hypothetical protein BDV96DRAFT_608287 [Lophiotrema nucula]